MKFRSDIRVDLVQSWGSDELIAQAARTSTGNESTGKIKGLIGYLLRNAHWSPFEHCGATFRVEAPLFVRDQWVRHKSQSFSVQSFRFGEAQPEFYVPGPERPLVNEGSGAYPKLVPGDEALKDDVTFAHRETAHDAWNWYIHLINLGTAEEVARNVLPASVYTKFYVSASLRNWLHFIDLRITSEKSASQWEISQASLQVETALANLFPVTMQERP